MAVSASGIVDDLMKGFLAVQKYMSRPSGEKVGKVSSEEESHNSEHEKMVCPFCGHTAFVLRATPHNLHLQTKPPSKMLSG